jgi:hypothetical protein
LFSIEDIVWKRMLKRLWGVIHQEMSFREDSLKYQGKNSEIAWNEYLAITELYFTFLKSTFGDIYREKSPLTTELKFENAVRALTSHHLMYLGDLCKFKDRYIKNQRTKQANKKQSQE